MLFAHLVPSLIILCFFQRHQKDNPMVICWGADALPVSLLFDAFICPQMNFGASIRKLGRSCKHSVHVCNPLKLIVYFNNLRLSRSLNRWETNISKLQLFPETSLWQSFPMRNEVDNWFFVLALTGQHLELSPPHRSNAGNKLDTTNVTISTLLFSARDHPSRDECCGRSVQVSCHPLQPLIRN